PHPPILPSPHPSTRPIALPLPLSNRTLARQGQELALACYLSETLSDLGIAVRVILKSIPCTLTSSVYSNGLPLGTLLTTKRLWVACEAIYSPAPSLVGETIAQRLRDLELEGYRDAVILFQVAGEKKPDWLLRVDLTLPEDMLREWARWGDVEAIRRLLNQGLKNFGLQVSTASLKETTLHLFCGFPSKRRVTTKANAKVDPLIPHQGQVKTIATPLLETLAPQGIHSATIYGQVVGEETPAWVEWLELPANLHPALAESAVALAEQGDWEAIAFLLHRLLNPDLDKYLATGGIRLQLLPKPDPTGIDLNDPPCPKYLLHIMSEAPICPEQRRVGRTIVRFLKSLKRQDITGVRIYGRRAGQKQPLWSYGVDFVSRDRLVPEATPEFAATDAYISDLLSESGESGIRPDLTPADVQTAWVTLRQRIVHTLQHLLVHSQLFVYRPPDSQVETLALPGEINRRQHGATLAIVWGVLGILLTFQMNWAFGKLIRFAKAREHAKPPIAQITPSLPHPPTPSTSVISSTTPVTSEGKSDLSESAIPDLTSPRSPDTDTEAFQVEGFTTPAPVTASSDEIPASTAPRPAEKPVENPVEKPVATAPTPGDLPHTPPNPAANLALAENLAADPPISSFNSRQLNDKLKLYYRVLEESGPPDVMIIGSSRALRGVDPAALEKVLANAGYPDIKVFNFGVNGATAQVVDLLMRQVLKPDQLPRLILWADGARAFNSHAVDVTFNGIVASPAYQELIQGRLVLPNPQMPSTDAANYPVVVSNPRSINLSLTDSYKALDRWFSSQLGIASGIYGERDRLKNLLKDGVTTLLPNPQPPLPNPTATPTHSAVNLPPDYELVDLDGFLSLGIQFNPATYYQEYAKVPGAYDRDYNDFQIRGSQETALITFLQYTQAQQIPVVFVNLPMTDEYLDADRLAPEQAFRDYMVNLDLRHPGLSFRDLGELWTTDYHYFSDPSHLNRYGAYAASDRLAQDPLIPWVRK
ncbi:MAG: hypothetical protein HC769_02200, partial [Cyanobacteria bacterium CRU_2_1]|nr:hypothetical protein [Cyanobacteria bacterium CRU_2_1]